MTDDGRAQRKTLELLQGRLKEAQEDLDLAHSEGFEEALKALSQEALAAEGEAGAQERQVRATAEQLALFRRDVAEAERQLLAPRTKSEVSPALGALAFATAVGAVVGVGILLSQGPTPFGDAVMVAGSVLPAPALAWLWRRRLNERSRRARASSAP